MHITKDNRILVFSSGSQVSISTIRGVSIAEFSVASNLPKRLLLHSTIATFDEPFTDEALALAKSAHRMAERGVVGSAQQSGSIDLDLDLLAESLFTAGREARTEALDWQGAEYMSWLWGDLDESEREIWRRIAEAAIANASQATRGA